MLNYSCSRWLNSFLNSFGSLDMLPDGLDYFVNYKKLYSRVYIYAKLFEEAPVLGSSIGIRHFPHVLPPAFLALSHFVHRSVHDSCFKLSSNWASTETLAYHTKFCCHEYVIGTTLKSRRKLLRKIKPYHCDGYTSNTTINNLPIECNLSTLTFTNRLLSGQFGTKYSQELLYFLCSQNLFHSLFCLTCGGKVYKSELAQAHSAQTMVLSLNRR